MFRLKRLLLVIISTLIFTMAFSTMAFAIEVNADSQSQNSGDSVILPVYWYHQIFSDKPLYIHDADTDTWYDSVKGTVEIKWSNYVSMAKSLTADLQVPDGTYQFNLVTTDSCSSDSIEGTFNIIKNGVVVASNIKGQVYGLSLAEGNYFKFYSNDTKWHFSAYITKRIDG
ncbi:hypothetical protein [Clostridium sp. BNL1100]|uniref:hypothetical protein n=1 Tax=Clostridium sp. BNL1100 TaxID=755731 RepID=UPI00024A7C58|nr:hypothetical protein [Clostridium sp. BNL1100]AEY64492.1 hypothetical protein Clo1100_0202 [Clostridium sp. BNL1100]